MSHDIFLQRIDRGEAGFCSSEETRACLDLLIPVLPEGHDPTIWGRITVPSGAGSEINPTFENVRFVSAMFHIRGFSDDLGAFIFALARAGSLIIIDSSGHDTVERPLVYAPSQVALDRMEIDSFENPCLCETEEKFIQMIAGGYQAWKTFRDSVLN